MITLLNQQLANTFDLYSQVKYAHWNVKGRRFMQLHLLFDELADGLFGYVDTLAERISALGGVAMGTLAMSATNSQLETFPVDDTADNAMLNILIQRYTAHRDSLHVALDTATEMNDPVTTDLFTQLLSTVEKHLWFLQAHLQG